MTPSRTTWLLLCSAALTACGAVGGSTCVAAGTPIAVTRTNGSGACSTAVVAGVTAVAQTFTPMKSVSCGVDHYSLNVGFVEQGSQTACQGSDVIAFPDFGPDGGSGTDTMSVTCDGGTTCTETFDVTFTPQ